MSCKTVRTGSHRWINPFRTDRRSLAAFRMALGLLVVWEALTFLVDPALLTDRGPLPLSILHSEVLPPHAALWSVYAISGSTLIVQLLLLAQIAVAVCLTAGWHPRAAAMGCWALVASTHCRNPLAAHGGDTLLRMELLLASLVPLGARTADVSGPPVVLLLSQPLVMYVVSAILKCSPSWRDPQELTAVHFALHVDMAAKPLARTLREFQTLTRLASLLTPHVELWTPLLLLCPLPRLRGPAVALALGVLGALQASFFCCLVLGNFPFISTIALLPFVPGSWWDRYTTSRLDGGAGRRAPSLSAASTIAGHADGSRRAMVSTGAGCEAVHAERADRRVCERASGLAALALGVWVAWWNQAYHCEMMRTHAAARDWPDCTGCAACRVRLRLPAGALWTFGEVFSLQQSWDLFAPEPNREDGYWVTARAALEAAPTRPPTAAP